MELADFKHIMGKGREDIRIKLLPVMWVCQIVTCDVGVSKLVFCFFSNPYISPFNSKNF